MKIWKRERRIKKNGFPVRRVWSWPRINANSIPNTCKSYKYINRINIGGIRVHNNKYIARGMGRWQISTFKAQQRHKKLRSEKKKSTPGKACIWLAGWRGNSPTRQWSIADLERMNSHTGTETRPRLLHKRQQWGIFHNGQKPDEVMLYEGRQLLGL